jgi:hypothetical protein
MLPLDGAGVENNSAQNTILQMVFISTIEDKENTME